MLTAYTADHSLQSIPAKEDSRVFIMTGYLNHLPMSPTNFALIQKLVAENGPDMFTLVEVSFSKPTPATPKVKSPMARRHIFAAGTARRNLNF